MGGKLIDQKEKGKENETRQHVLCEKMFCGKGQGYIALGYFVRGEVEVFFLNLAKTLQFEKIESDT